MCRYTSGLILALACAKRCQSASCWPAPPARRREIALTHERVAGRLRSVRQLLTESVLFCHRSRQVWAYWSQSGEVVFSLCCWPTQRTSPSTRLDLARLGAAEGLTVLTVYYSARFPGACSHAGGPHAGPKGNASRGPAGCSPAFWQVSLTTADGGQIAIRSVMRVAAACLSGRVESGIDRTRRHRVTWRPFQSGPQRPDTRTRERPAFYATTQRSRDSGRAQARLAGGSPLARLAGTYRAAFLGRQRNPANR